MNNTTLTQQLTDKEIAKALGISRMTVWRWKKAGRLPQPRKIGATLTQQLTVKEVAAALGICTMTVWRWTKAGRLPQPRKIGDNTTRWDSLEVAEAIHKTAA